MFHHYTEKVKGYRAKGFGRDNFRQALCSSFSYFVLSFGIPAIRRSGMAYKGSVSWQLSWFVQENSTNTPLASWFWDRSLSEGNVLLSTCTLQWRLAGDEPLAF